MSYYLTTIPGTKFFLNMPRRETPEEIEAHERRYNETTEWIRTMATNLAIEAAFLASTKEAAENFALPFVNNNIDPKYYDHKNPACVLLKHSAEAAAIDAWHSAWLAKKTDEEIEEAAKAAAIKALGFLYLTPERSAKLTAEYLEMKRAAAWRPILEKSGRYAFALKKWSTAMAPVVAAIKARRR